MTYIRQITECAPNEFEQHVVGEENDKWRLVGWYSKNGMFQFVWEREDKKTSNVRALNDEQLKGFDNFWKEYPKHVAKPSAVGAWKMIKPEEYAKLLLALENNKNTVWLGEESKFIPHPATWLNQKRWQDETVSTLDEYGEVPPKWKDTIKMRVKKYKDGTGKAPSPEKITEWVARLNNGESIL